jgi:hypothetical protein
LALLCCVTWLGIKHNLVCLRDLGHEVLFEGFASAAGPLTCPAAQQIGGPADCCSVEAVEGSSFVARLVCKGSLVGCLVGWLVG